MKLNCKINIGNNNNLINNYYKIHIIMEISILNVHVFINVYYIGTLIVSF